MKFGLTFRSLPLALGAALTVSGCATVPDEMTERYVAVEGGAQFWPDTSNHDELEAGREAGVMFGAAVGTRAQVHGIASRVEIEATHRENDIHGRNGPGCNETSCSADHLHDNVLQGTSVMINAWPELPVTEDLSFYAGGGVGGAYVTGLGDEAFTPVA